jgi:hypothetical protein
MHCASAIWPSVAFPALQYFSTLYYKQHDFRRKKERLLNIKCVLFFLEVYSDTLPILRRNDRRMIKNVYWFSKEVSVILARF